MKNKRSPLESCMDLMESFNGNDRIIVSRIFYRSNVGFDKIKIYLDFLKIKGLVDSDPPNKKGTGHQGEAYFLTEYGRQFKRDWKNYKRENEIEILKDLLKKT